MDIRVWGPTTWNFLHAYSLAYPIKPTRDDERHAYTLLRAVQRNLPCESCRTHFETLMNEMPPRLESRDAFVEWLVDAHNRVNERLHKPHVTVAEMRESFLKSKSIDDVVLHQARFRERHGVRTSALLSSGTAKNTNLSVIAVCVLIGVVVGAIAAGAIGYSAGKRRSARSAHRG